MKHNRFITWIIASSLFIVFLGRLQIVLTRYFDPDEFAHLHWAYLMSAGNLPYRDIFLYHIPVFQWFLRPLFFLPPSSSTLILARIMMFLVYLGIALLMLIMTKRITKNFHTALVSATLFFVFPMTFDKSIEVRPDMLMILFFLLSVLLLTAPPKRSLSILSGLCYGISILIFPKMLFAFPAILYLLIVLARDYVSRHVLRYWIIGFILPPVLFLFYLASAGIFPSAVEAFVKTSVIVYSGKPRFSPLVSLSPFPLVYIERGGTSLPWVINVLVLVSSIFGLATLFRSNKRFALFSILFLAFGGLFLFMFPSPYMQYFLPFSVMVSILSGVMIVQKIHTVHSMSKQIVLMIGIMGVLLLSFAQQYAVRVDRKANNSEQLQVVTDVLRISKPTESFYDVVGSYVFRPDGYRICCHPYAEFINRLNPKPITLAESLVEKQTKFLIMDRTGLIFWLTPQPDLDFLLSNYLPSQYRKIYTLGQQFSCANTICTQISAEGKPLAVKDAVTIVTAERYKISVQPPGARISLGPEAFADGDIVFLQAQSYKLSVPAPVSTVSVHLDR